MDTRNKYLNKLFNTTQKEHENVTDKLNKLKLDFEHNRAVGRDLEVQINNLYKESKKIDNTLNRLKQMSTQLSSELQYRSLNSKQLNVPDQFIKLMI